jgi:hypothetical protein
MLESRLNPGQEFTFANPSYRFFTAQSSLIGRSAADLRNQNETPVESGTVLTFTTGSRKNGSPTIVTDLGTVSTRVTASYGVVVGFRLEGTTLHEESDEKKATHQFFVVKSKLRSLKITADNGDIHTLTLPQE